MSDKNCRDCKWAGMDMDMEPYCAHPQTLVTMPHGSNLCRRDPARDHCGETKASFEERDQ